MKIAEGHRGHHQGHSHDPINDPFDDWLQLYYFALNLTYQFEPVIPKEDDKKTLWADASRVFRGLLTHITVYDNNHKPHKVFDLRQPQIPAQATRVVAHVKHLKIECHFTEAKTLEHISASGFQYDVMGGDSKNEDDILIESDSAIMERTCAAYSIAKMAKDSGLSKVNFMDTTNPLDRALLIEACHHFELDYGQETIYESVVSGVTVDLPEYFPVLLSFKDDMDEVSSHLDESERNYTQMVAINALGRFLDRQSIKTKGYDRPSNLMTQPVETSAVVSSGGVSQHAAQAALAGF